jgi:hypothetical protein
MGHIQGDAEEFTVVAPHQFVKSRRISAFGRFYERKIRINRGEGNFQGACH